MTYTTTPDGTRITYRGRRAQIIVWGEGVHFACAAAVVQEGQRVYSTRPYPFGCSANAYADALDHTDQRVEPDPRHAPDGRVYTPRELDEDSEVLP